MRKLIYKNKDSPVTDVMADSTCEFNLKHLTAELGFGKQNRQISKHFGKTPFLSHSQIQLHCRHLSSLLPRFHSPSSHCSLHSLLTARQQMKQAPGASVQLCSFSLLYCPFLLSFFCSGVDSSMAIISSGQYLLQCKSPIQFFQGGDRLQNGACLTAVVLLFPLFFTCSITLCVFCLFLNMSSQRHHKFLQFPLSLACSGSFAELA